MQEHIGIVHLGLGAFHRAHQAVSLQRYRQHSGAHEWGVCNANLRSNSQLADQLRQANLRYHVAACADTEHVDAFLAVDAVFPASLANRPEFVQATGAAYQRLATHGVADSIAHIDELFV